MKIEEYIAVSSAKARLLEILRKIEEQHGKVVITKNGFPKAVLINYEDFEGLLETIDILSDAEMMKGVKKGLQDIRAGRVVSLKEAFKD
ncbi:MAG: type II toxin-antitoxin system Phd/YefM family antitoxin [Candidatus Binatia bacterium]